jgi:hypothetical protein
MTATTRQGDDLPAEPAELVCRACGSPLRPEDYRALWRDEFERCAACGGLEFELRPDPAGRH